MLRYASPNERRTISREDLGFYHAVIISAVYEFDNNFDVTAPASFYTPIAHCIAQHPFLSVLVKERHTDKAYYQRAPHVDLSEHVTIRPAVVDPSDGAKWSAIQSLLASELDRPFSHTIPPWRVLVTPLPPPKSKTTRKSSCVITFSFSHSILDGPSGLSFHRTLLSALNNPMIPTSTAPKVEACALPLPPPFDTPTNLPISPSFLLAPLLGEILPAFLTKLLNLAPQAVTASGDTWTGAPCAFEAGTTESNVLVRAIEAETLTKVLRSAREHEAKLTGVMHVLVTRALRAALASVGQTGSDGQGLELMAVTAIDMRGAVGREAGEMGEFASGAYTAFEPYGASDEGSVLTEREWEEARRVTGQLAEAKGQLKDQAVGLLRFVPSVRGWLAKKVGSRRDCSYEVSNVGVFDAGEGGPARIADVVFAQPGMAVSCPICINVASAKGGRLVYSVTWKRKALGIEEGEEVGFMVRFCGLVDDGFKGL